MAESGRARSILASAVGWLIVGLIVWFFFGTIVGTVRYALRIVLIIVIVGGLIWLYFRLKRGGDE